MAAGAKIRGITIEIGADTKELKNSLNDVNNSLSKTKSALRDTNNLLKFNTNSTDLIKQKQGYLKQAIEETNQKLKAERAALEELERQDGGKKQSEAQKALRRDIEANEQQLKKLKAEYESCASVAGVKMQNIGKSMQDVGSKMSSVGTNISTYVTLPLAAVGTAAIKTTADFDESMSKVKAISGATGDDFEKLRDKAREMGSKTKFSASEAAEGMTYMAMAGWDTNQMLDGLEGIMNLAAASGEDLATTSDIVTDALTAFGLEAKDSGHFADVLAAASSNANTNVSMMGETFKYAAPVAGALGFSVEDTATAIGLMANAGIKGSQAGTSLRTILTALTGEVKISGKALGEVTIQTTNADGSMRSLSDILADCRGAFSKLSESEKAQTAESIAGKNAMSGFLSLMNAGQGDVDKLSNAINNCDGVTKQMADDMQNNLSGQLKILKSMLEEVAIQIGDALMPTIKKVIEKIQEWVQKFSNLDQGTKEIIVKIGMVVAAIGPLLVVGGKVTQGLGTIISTAGSLISKIAANGGLVASITSLINPVTLVTAAIGALVAGATLWANHIKKQIEAEYGLSESQRKLIDNIHEENKAYNEFSQRQQESVDNALAETNNLRALVEEYNNHVGANGKVQAGYEERAQFILTTLAEAFGKEKSDIEALIDKNGKLTQGVNDLIEAQRREALLSAYQESYKEALQKSTDAWKKYREASELASECEKKYKDHVKESGGALAEYTRLVGEGHVNAAKNYLIWNGKSVLAEMELQKSWSESKKAAEEAEQTYTGYTMTVKNYEGVQSAIITGDNDKIQDSLLKLQYNFKTTETANRDSLKQQVKDYDQMYADTQKAIKEGAPGVTQQTLKEIGQMRDAAIKELAKNTLEMIKAGEDGGKGFANGIGGTRNDATNAGRNIATAGTEGAKGVKWEPHGRQLGYDFSTGINNTKSNASSAGQNLSTSAANGTKNVNGRGYGQQFGNDYTSGVNGTQYNAGNAGRNIANSAANGTKNVNGRGYGQQFGNDYTSGVNGTQYNAGTAGRNIANSAANGTKNVSGRNCGTQFGNDYTSGVNGTQYSAGNAGRNIATSAANSAGNVSARNAGVNFGNGFINGLDSRVQAAATTAWNMAVSAMNSMNRALGIASPSKVARKTGVFFGEGFSLGIEDMLKPVKVAAEDMGIIASDALADSMDSSLLLSMNQSSKSASVIAAGRHQVAAGDSITNTSTTNLGGVTINVHAAPGQDPNEIAEIVQRKIAAQTARRQAVFG